LGAVSLTKEHRRGRGIASLLKRARRADSSTTRTIVKLALVAVEGDVPINKLNGREKWGNEGIGHSRRRMKRRRRDVVVAARGNQAEQHVCTHIIPTIDI
jgi:hypothetical protein